MRDRSRFHPTAVAHPVAHPSDLGFRGVTTGAGGLVSAWAFPGSCSAAGAVVCGGTYVLVTPNHPGGHLSLQAFGWFRGLAGWWGSACWAWFRSGDAFGAVYLGFLRRSPREGRVRDASRGEQQRGCVWVGGREGPGGIRRMDRTRGEREPGERGMGERGMGTYVPLGVGDICPRRGCGLWLRGVAKFSLKWGHVSPWAVGTYVPMGCGMGFRGGGRDVGCVVCPLAGARVVPEARMADNLLA